MLKVIVVSPFSLQPSAFNLSFVPWTAVVPGSVVD
jgi:hypothetical protein